MRKDPPFNLEYIYCTYVLDLAQNQGSKVINQPSALRNFNEKVSITLFPSMTPQTLVTSSIDEIKVFLGRHEKIVVKPLDGMGGRSVFVVDDNDLNAHSIFETITNLSSVTIMAQAYVPEILQGDKRIHIVYGQHCNTALARIPSDHDNRGNLVMGATGQTQELSSRDKEICEAIGPTLLDHGIYFAGIDVIGDYLTEINITSPTGMREIKRYAGEDVSGFFFDCLESRDQ
jgi:glutathione synthase